jgi:RNA polymerase sigma-70 factor, ECF subfamily
LLRFMAIYVAPRRGAGGHEMRRVAKQQARTPQSARPRFADAIVHVLPDLRAFARFLARDADVADEMVQETLSKALAAEDQFTPGTKLKAWLFTILRNQFYSYLRRRRRDPGFVDAQAAAQIGVAPAQDTRTILSDLQRALGRLSHEQREALILIGANGMSYEEGARICGCSVGTMKSRVSRARAELRRLL